VEEWDMDSREVRVLMQVPCERCEGSGRVGWDSPTAGGYAADHTKPCPDCSERGHLEASVGLAEFKRLLGL
jgi:DnaJ-class molecular chaperone